MSAQGLALMTEDEAAQVLRVCPRTLRKERQAGRLPYIVIGRVIRYSASDLHDYIERARQCLSTSEPARRSGNIRSRSTVLDFEALRAKRTGGKPKG